MGFSKGDKVLCIDIDSSCLILYAIYTVTETHRDFLEDTQYLYLHGEDSGWYASRFILDTPASRLLFLK